MSSNRFECKKAYNYLIIEFQTTEIQNKKKMKIRVRGNVTETQIMMKDFLNHIV